MYNRGTPFFSWSPLREELFNECELCYILNYYTAHKGWYASSSTESVASYRWKQAKTIRQQMEMSFVDELIDEVYGDESFSAKRLRSKVLEDINLAVSQSIANKNEWYLRPKSIKMLYELVHENKVSNKLVSDITNTLDDFIKGFLKSQLIKDLSSEGNELIEVKQLFKQGFSYYEVKDLNIRAYANVQVVHKSANGKYIASIFKLNDKGTSLSQVGAVANVVAEALDIDITDVIIREECLVSYNHTDYEITEDLIKLTHAALLDSVSMMSEFLVDSNIDKNEFIGFNKCHYTRSLDHPSISNSDLSMSNCSYCQAVQKDLKFFPNGYDNTIDEIIKKAI